MGRTNWVRCLYFCRSLQGCSNISRCQVINRYSASLSLHICLPGPSRSTHIIEACCRNKLPCFAKIDGQSIYPCFLSPSPHVKHWVVGGSSKGSKNISTMGYQSIYSVNVNPQAWNLILRPRMAGTCHMRLKRPSNGDSELFLNPMHAINQAAWWPATFI